MKVIKLELKNSYMSANCYLLIKDRDCVLIDPTFPDQKLFDYLQKEKLNLTKIVLTHGHYDHWTGLEQLKKIYPSTLVYASSLDSYWFNNNPFTNYLPKIDIDLNLLDEIDFLGEIFKIYKTPGHSLGSISFYNNNILFVGDLIFFESVGRTDLDGGNYDTLLTSIKTILNLPKETIIYPGHGRATTVGHEIKHNPFLASI